MVYKKYIKRNGKIYGPYYYSSRRVNGKVISEYHGPTESSKSFNFLWIVIGTLLVVGFGYFLFNSGGNGNLTGNAVLNLNANYVSGDILDGKLNINLNEGELIPASSSVVFENGGNSYKFNLSDLVESSPIEGEYYVAGSDLSGKGLGYGAISNLENSPNVYFEFEIYGKNNGKSNSNKSVNTEIVFLNETNSSFSNETVILNESTGENINDTSNETPSDNVLGKGNLSLGLTLTGNAISNGDVVVNKISGSVRYGEEYNITLEKGQSAKLISGSVRTDSIQLNDSDLKIRYNSGVIVVETTYVERTSGFGENYISDKTVVLPIDLNKLNLSFSEGELIVKIIDGNKNLVNLRTTLDKNNSFVNETSPVIKLNNTNSTLNSSVQVEIFGSKLTEEEKALLLEKYGENASVNVASSEIKNNRLVVIYEIGDKWFRSTYNSNISEDALYKQMEEDRNKWLRDVAESLRIPNESSRGVNITRNYPI